VNKIHELAAQGKSIQDILSILKAFVHPLHPPVGGCAPVIRYEIKPGEQMQFDWDEFKYEQDGVARKLYGFSAILCYSRMRFLYNKEGTRDDSGVDCGRS
jgi:hypothetical protein